MQEFISKNRSVLIIVGLIIIILSLFIYTSTKSSSSDTKAPSQAEVEIKLGEEDALNSLVVYLDPLCDRCHQFTEEVVQDLNKNEVKNGELNISIRPLSIFSEQSSTINEITLCADNQGKFLEASLLIGDKLHDESEETTVQERAKKFLADSPAKLLAGELDLNRQKLQDCMDDNINTAKLTEQDDVAQSNGIVSTPTIYINDSEPIRGYSQIGFIRNQLKL